MRFILAVSPLLYLALAQIEPNNFPVVTQYAEQQTGDADAPNTPQRPSPPRQYGVLTLDDFQNRQAPQEIPALDANGNLEEKPDLSPEGFHHRCRRCWFLPDPARFFCLSACRGYPSPGFNFQCSYCFAFSSTFGRLLCFQQCQRPAVCCRDCFGLTQFERLACLGQCRPDCPTFPGSFDGFGGRPRGEIDISLSGSL